MGEVTGLSFGLLVLLLVVPGKYARVAQFGKCIWVNDEQCPSDYVQFFHYSRDAFNEPVVVQLNDTTETLYSTAGRPVKIIIHGYNSNYRDIFLQNIKSAYLQREDADIWMVDWSQIVLGPCYLSAINNIEFAGKCVSQLVHKLSQTNPNIYDTLHIIGFSLGAHVTASTATFLKPKQVNRISGLDPAFPLMNLQSSDNKLHKNAAVFVDVIHTNCLVQGQLEPSGDVDVYMNDGTFQPGCSNDTTFLDGLNCDHHRSAEYFTESINSQVGFWGWKCNSFFMYVFGECRLHPGTSLYLLGDQVNRTMKGVFRVMTNSKSPFAMGRNLLNLQRVQFRKGRV